MKLLRKIPVFLAFAVAAAGFGLAGCGNSGEGQIKVGSSVRKSLADDEAAPNNKEDAPKQSKGGDGNVKSRLGGRGEN